MQKRRSEGLHLTLSQCCLRLLIVNLIGVSMMLLAIFFLPDVLSFAVHTASSRAAPSSSPISQQASPFAPVDHLLAAIRENAPESIRDRCLAIVEGKEGSLDASFSQVEAAHYCRSAF